MRTTRTRALAIAIVAMLGVATIGCGRNDNTQNASSGSTPSGGTPKAGPGFDGTTISLGVVTPQTGQAAVIGNPLTAGNQLYVDRVNAAGGIGGKYKVKLVVGDSKYQPQDALQVYNSQKANVAMFVQLLGTAIVDAIKGQLGTDSIYAGPATLDAFWVREPNLMPIGAPYQIQMINGVNYAVKSLDAKNKKLCAFTKDDPYGQAALSGLEYGAEKEGVSIVTKVTYKTGDTDFTAQVTQLQSAGCEIVALTSLPSDTAAIMGKAAGAKFAPKWLGSSPDLVNALTVGTDGKPTALAPYLQANFLLLSDGTQWGDETIPGMKQMIEDVNKFAPTQQPDGFFTFGYAQMWAAAQVLEQAVKDGDLSPKGIQQASTKIDKLTFGQLLGDYKYGSAEDRDPPRNTTIFAIDPAVPGTTKAVEKNIVSDAAKSYEFPS